jgi:HEPN domain-containing protein
MVLCSIMPDDIVFAWIERVEEDYLLIRSCLRYKRPLVSSACFHAQQCTEKYLKAYLSQYKSDFPRTHDLLALKDLCLKASPFLLLDVGALERLNAYAVTARYPGETPTIEEAKQAYKDTQSIRRYLRKWLNL